jgi:hypothetical protein
VLTGCDGTNLSPKGRTAVWDDDHLIFANIRSPGTLANLRSNRVIRARKNGANDESSAPPT